VIPQTQPNQEGNSTKVNLIISFTFHAAIVLTLAFFAAREGLLGRQLRKITVEMVREKPPEKPKEPEKPRQEPPKPEPPKVAQTPKVQPPKEEPVQAQAPPPATVAVAAPVIAPPPAELPAFAFDGGKTVQTASDPVQLYKGFVEYALRSKWNRPLDLEDAGFVAEVEVRVDRNGELSDPVWKKSSGNARWDTSVRAAIAQTPALDRPPPASFPARVLIRFDVQESTEPLSQ
jgi:outer membrane biosynthesis protein TonB